MRSHPLPRRSATSQTDFSLRTLLGVAGAVLFWTGNHSAAQSLALVPADRRAEPAVEAASVDALAASKYFDLAPGFTARLWAAEPMLANPVAISFDERGRLYVTETHRYRTSALDIRDYPALLERDLASQTVADRTKLMTEAFGSQTSQLGLESDRIRVLEDTKGDGSASASQVFASGFDSPAHGTAAGVLAQRGQVWLASAPNLYALTPGATGTSATSRAELVRGFSVHVGFAGHDLHGLIMGPDGKLYFSVGDQGAQIEGKDGKSLDLPDSGAIFRCNPDGSRLEVVATGLRNPRELAFDDFGNLFTADSASGHGDLARFIHVIDGGDSGWRLGYQPAPLDEASPWVREGLWRPHFEAQPAYLLPPVCNIESGPRGLAYYPGTGLTPDFLGKFFLSQVNGGPADSSIRTYSLTPDGAGFKAAATGTFLRGAMPTDVAFGPDGRLYFSDWVSGWPWPKSGRGRIYAVASTNPVAADVAAAAQTREFLAAGTASRTPEELARALGHPDQRVRLAAQFELASRGRPSVPVFQAVAEKADAPRLARLHAIWGMGQLADLVPGALNIVPSLLDDKDGEVRAQAAKVLGDNFRIEGFRTLTLALRDPEPRVAFFAAQSLGKFKQGGAAAALIGLLRKNDGQDAALRHAIVIALARLGPTPALAATVKDPSRAVRLGGLLAYRRLEDPAVAAFLDDFDSFIVREAARAINDVPIAGALPALAALLNSAPLDDEALVRRSINAHFRLGQTENAEALADFASHPYVPAALRAEALNQLARWATPPARDRITGLARPLPPRDATPASQALLKFLGQLAGKTPVEVQVATIAAVADLKIKGTGHALWDTVYQADRPVRAQIAALHALEKANDLRLEVAAGQSGHSPRAEVRLASIPVLARLHPAVSLPVLGPLASKGSAAEQSLVYSLLAGIDDPRTDEILVQAIQRLATGGVPLAAQADLLDTAAKRKSPEVATALKQLTDAWATGTDRLAPFRSALEGGNPDEGRRLFERHPKLACLKCHETNRGSNESGPVLKGIAGLRSKESLLESVILPNAQIAPGFARTSLTLGGRSVETGVVVQENETRLEIRRDDRTTSTIQKKDIVRRETLPSSMPGGVGQILSHTELRNLMAYLSELTSPREGQR